MVKTEGKKDHSRGKGENEERKKKKQRTLFGANNSIFDKTCPSNTYGERIILFDD